VVSKRIDGVFYDTDSLAWAAKQPPQTFQLLAPQYKKPVGSDIVALGLAKNSARAQSRPQRSRDNAPLRRVWDRTRGPTPASARQELTGRQG
jgi:polar amino acid transport system substrate-binding protein